jgi:hypothetical protein
MNGDEIAANGGRFMANAGRFAVKREAVTETGGHFIVTGPRSWRPAAVSP